MASWTTYICIFCCKPLLWPVERDFAHCLSEAACGSLAWALDACGLVACAWCVCAKCEPWLFPGVVGCCRLATLWVARATLVTLGVALRIWSLLVYPLRVESLRVVWTRVWSLCVGTRVCWASPLLPVSTEAPAVCARGDCDNRGGACGEEGS